MSCLPACTGSRCATGSWRARTFPRALEELRSTEGLDYDPMQASFFLGREVLVRAMVPKLPKWRLFLFLLLAAIPSPRRSSSGSRATASWSSASGSLISTLIVPTRAEALKARRSRWRSTSAMALLATLGHKGERRPAGERLPADFSRKPGPGCSEQVLPNGGRSAQQRVRFRLRAAQAKPGPDSTGARSGARDRAGAPPRPARPTDPSTPRTLRRQSTAPAHGPRHHSSWAGREQAVPTLTETSMWPPHLPAAA